MKLLYSKIDIDRIFLLCLTMRSQSWNNSELDLTVIVRHFVSIWKSSSGSNACLFGILMI